MYLYLILIRRRDEENVATGSCGNGDVGRTSRPRAGCAQKKWTASPLLVSSSSSSLSLPSSTSLPLLWCRTADMAAVIAIVVVVTGAAIVVVLVHLEWLWSSSAVVSPALRRWGCRSGPWLAQRSICAGPGLSTW